MECAEDSSTCSSAPAAEDLVDTVVLCACLVFASLGIAIGLLQFDCVSRRVLSPGRLLA